MRPPSPLFLFNGVGMLLVAAAAVMLGGRGKRLLWRVLGIGAGAWALSVALKFVGNPPRTPRFGVGLSGFSAQRPAHLSTGCFWAC